MNAPRISAALACLAIASCTSGVKPQPVHDDTAECMKYRSMMTAPMPPDAMERLRMTCEASRNR